MPVLIKERAATRLLERSSSTDLVKCATGASRAKYRASGLNLSIAAIILCNTRYLEQMLVELERQDVDVSPTIVAHVAPLGREHVGLTGDMSGATDSSRPMVPFGRSGGENLCSQPKYPIDYGLMNLRRPVSINESFIQALLSGF